jgi:hypothetical protein
VKPVTDPFGNLLTTGTRVAYNLSGQVAIGEITEIKKTMRYDRTRYVLTIVREGIFKDWPKRATVSKVHSENVCVITERVKR